MLKNPTSLCLLAVMLTPSISLKAGDSHVGDVRYSILSETQFQKLHGPEWELLKGQALASDSELRELWGRSNVPDARGVFLRCANHGRSTDSGNPNGDSAVGTYHRDQFASHNHGGGHHSHDFRCEYTASRNFRGDIHNTMAWFPERHQNHSTESSGRIIETQGGAETRPRNVIINAFIKVRESATENPNIDFNDEVVDKLFRSRAFTARLEQSLSSTIENLRK